MYTIIIILSCRTHGSGKHSKPVICHHSTFSSPWTGLPKTSGKNRSIEIFKCLSSECRMHFCIVKCDYFNNFAILQRWAAAVLETAEKFGRVPRVPGVLQRLHPSG